MNLLQESAELAQNYLGNDIERLNVARLVIGLYFTGVKLTNGAGGVCFTPVKDIPEAVCCPSSVDTTFNPLKIRGMPVREVLPSLSSSHPIKTAVAVAVLNALSSLCWQRGFTDTYKMHVGVDGQDLVNMPQEKSVAVVGALVPTLRTLRERGGTWWVIEQDPRTLKEDEMPHYVPATISADVLAEADVLVITGVTLLNHTLEGILGKTKPGAEIAVIGPTASMLPEPMFRRGVRISGGVWVRQADELLDVLFAGGSGYHFFHTFADRVTLQRVEGQAFL
jgi:uncharacterized protein (DUF4213/DUF364 family)